MLRKFHIEELENFWKHIRVDEKEDGVLFSQVTEIVRRVHREGDKALSFYTRKFDGVEIRDGDVAVSQKEFKVARERVDSTFKGAIAAAIKNITRFHSLQKTESLEYKGESGEKLSLRVRPIERVGIYVPGGSGGNTPLVSTVLMNAIPARLAGASEIVAVSPPQKGMTLDPHLLYALQEVGVSHAFKCGGAQAIAACSYGTETIPRCHIIVGPGNKYVTAAKRIVFGDVMIDGVYGPSEIVVISDGSGDARHTASDLISQAEHAGDELSVLITPDETFAEEVCQCIEKQSALLERKSLIESSLRSRGACVRVRNLDEAIDIANRIAPEHLELDIEDAESYVDRITHAGAIFIGRFTPEPIGDYISGTNHVLPTRGAAKFASPLGVYTFQKRTNVIRYTREAFVRDAPHAMKLADVEGLTAHRDALAIRGVL